MAAAKQNKPKEVNLLLIIVLIVLFIALAFVLTKDDKNDTPVSDPASVSDSSAAASEEESSAAEESTAGVQESDELTPDEIIDLFIKANNLQIGWVIHGFAPVMDFDTLITLETANGPRQYAKITDGEFTSVAAIKEALSQLFAAELYEEDVDGLYAMQGEQLYGVIELGQGGDVAPERLFLSVDSSTPEECKFSVTADYASSDAYTSEYTLQFTDGKWIFVDQFIGNLGLYSDNDLPWDIE